MKSCDRSTERGFSLVEVLISLAIASLLTVGIFSSLGTQLEQLSRLDGVLSSDLEKVRTRRMLSSTIGMSLPAYSNEKNMAFQGSAQRISGSIPTDPSNLKWGLTAYEILITTDDEKSRLQLILNGVEFSKIDIDEKIQFSFYSNSGQRYSEWPIPVIGAGQNNLSQVLTSAENLPSLVTLEVISEAPKVFTSVPIQQSYTLPIRSKDIMD